MKTGKDIIQVRNVSFSYGNTSILKNIRFELTQGEVLGVIGESGSGKTSLMKLVAGLLSPASGELLYRGEKIAGPDETLVPGHEHIKLVNQDFDLMPYLSVEENMMRRSHALSESSRKKLLGHFRKRLKLSSVGSNRAVDTSGGQKQRIALATAVATKPDVLLLDEPFSNLDYPLKQQMIGLLKTEWRSKGMIIATHEPADMLAMADRILVLQKGKVAQTGNAEEVYHQPKNEYVARLLGPINVLQAYEARSFGAKVAKRLFLRPAHLKIDSKGIEAEVLECHFTPTGYLVTSLCEGINKELLLYSDVPVKGRIKVGLNLPKA